MKTTDYTFDQNRIQDDRTGNFLDAVEVTARCKPYTGQGIAVHRILIGADKSVRVFNPLDGCFTLCHSLSPASQRRIIKANVA